MTRSRPATINAAGWPAARARRGTPAAPRPIVTSRVRSLIQLIVLVALVIALIELVLPPLLNAAAAPFR